VAELLAAVATLVVVAVVKPTLVVAAPKVRLAVLDEAEVATPKVAAAVVAAPPKLRPVLAGVAAAVVAVVVAPKLSPVP